MANAVYMSGSRVVRNGAGRMFAKSAAGGAEPLWLSSRPALNTWFTIAGLNMAAGQTGYTAPGGGSDGKPGIMVWSAGAVCGGTKIVHAGGGHTNYSGNEVMGLDLSANSPAWQLLRAPTAVPTADVLHYSDNSPTSRHSYSEEWPDDSRGRLMFIGCGSGYGSSPANTFAVDGFNLANNTYDNSNDAGAATVTYPSSTTVGGLSHQTDLAACQDPSGNVYIVVPNNNVLKFDMSTLLYSTVGGSNFHYAGAGSGPACAYDTTRGRFLVFGDDSTAQKLYTVVNSTTVTESGVTFSGAQAGIIDVGCSMVYVPSIDRYLVWSSNAADQTVYQIHPTTFAVTTFALSGTPPVRSSAGGLDRAYGRFCRIPQYGIVAHYGHTTTSDFAFFRY